MSAGIAEFVRRIETLRAGGAADIDDAFVADGKLTEPIVPEVPLERPAFKTKRDAGRVPERAHPGRSRSPRRRRPRPVDVAIRVALGRGVPRAGG
jgi:hypothetical protein